MTTSTPLILPIGLRLVDQDVAKPSAWLLPGNDPELWLAEMCTWDVPLKSVRLLLVPAAPNQIRSIGALAIVPTDAADRVKPSPMAQPFARIHGRLFIPADARLHPPMSDAELSGWLRLDVNVLHPAIGLVGCRNDELHRVSDLITASEARADDWNRALPGLFVEPRLHSVKPDVLPSIEQIIGGLRGDIGEHSPDDLDPLPEESSINRALARGMQAPFQMLQWLARTLGGASSAGGSSESGGDNWLARLQGWSEQHLARLRESMQAARDREMTRLLRMLEQNPDQGLKYALPLADRGRSRGVAPPSVRLGLRKVDFNLGSLFGSRRSDPWRTSDETNRALMQKYRELATRELQLGRYRRAAYIFGELLRDLHAAADALKQGGFFREAAVIYRDEFKDKLAAAKCLESGGLLTDAIELYEAAGHWEHAGDLYRKLAQEERAEIAYRRALEQLRKRGDLLAAAKLLEEKLVKPDEALDLLTDAWPHAPAASACLAESFRLLDRLARHERAGERVAALRDTPPGDQRMMQPLADVMANLAVSYPVSSVKSLAADATRVIAGLRLPAAPESEARQLISAIRRAASEDKLLQRDGERYIIDLAKRPQPPRKAQPKLASPPPSSKAPVLLRAFQLTPSAQWRAALSTGSRFFAQGVQPNRVVIADGDWNGKSELAAAGKLPASDDAPYRLNFVSGYGLIVLPTGPGKDRLWVGHPPAFFIPPNLPPGAIYDSVVDESNILWVLHDDHRESSQSLLVSSFNLTGSILSTRFITYIAAENLEFPPALSVRSGRACVVVDDQIFFAADDSAAVQLSSEPVSVITSPLHTRWRAVVCFAEGGIVIWPAEKQLQSFGQGLIDPTACILREGMLVVAARGAGAIYQIEGFRVQHRAKISLPDRPPIAVVQTHNAAEFAIFYSDGLVQVMRAS